MGRSHDRFLSFIKRVVPLSVIDRVEPFIGQLPDRFGSRLNPARYRNLPRGPDDALSLPPAAVRVLIGPINTAGQAYQWAEAINRLPHHAALSLALFEPRGFLFSAHRLVPGQLVARSCDWNRREFAAVAAQVTHVLFESAHPIFGPLFRRNTLREVAALRRRGVRVAVIAHGSDVRDLTAHIAREPHSPYRFADLVPDRDAIHGAATRTRRIIQRMGVPVFGSTPNVRFDLPTATWLPVVVTPDEWRVTTPALEREVPVVLHAPSHSGVKGSEIADVVLSRLQAEGLIQYRRLEGEPHSAMRDAYAQCDVVVDSLRMGGYGVAACEAMAAGRLVVSYVNEHTRHYIASQYGQQPPIWPADVETLDAAVRSVLARREDAREIAARGPAYVRSLHDGRVSVAALADFLAR